SQRSQQAEEQSVDGQPAATTTPPVAGRRRQARDTANQVLEGRSVSYLHSRSRFFSAKADFTFCSIIYGSDEAPWTEVPALPGGRVEPAPSPTTGSLLGLRRNLVDFGGGSITMSDTTCSERIRPDHVCRESSISSGSTPCPAHRTSSASG